MAMPAIDALRRAMPQAEIRALVKQPLAALWSMLPAVDAVVPLGQGLGGTWRAIRGLAAWAPDCAYVLPNSIRSALIPLAAGVPVRHGLRGERPAWMLSRVADPPKDREHAHQVWEYFRVCGIEPLPAAVESPRLQVPGDATAKMAAVLGVEKGRRLIAILPGAAYGPSKQWPVRHFVAAGRALAAETGARIVVLGGGREAPACAEVQAGVGGDALNLAGATGLPELAAVLSRCALAVTNDSGGMHVAAAVGAPVVAVFGITDPRKTGPLGSRNRVVFQGGVPQARDLERDSPLAREVLESILPERVVAEGLSLMEALTHP